MMERWSVGELNPNTSPKNLEFELDFFGSKRETALKSLHLSILVGQCWAAYAATVPTRRAQPLALPVLLKRWVDGPTCRDGLL